MTIQCLLYQNKNNYMNKEKITKKDINFIKLNEFVKIPTFNFDPRAEFFVKFGDDNLLPEKILEYYNSVGLNRSIIQKKTSLLLGDGITFEAEDDLQSKKTLQFIKGVNDFETMDELFAKVALDYFLYGGCYLQIIWAKNGKKINKIYHMPYHKMRSGKANKYNIVEKFYYNPSDEKYKKWGKYSTKKDVIEFNSFSTKKLKSKPQILYIKNYEPSNIFYALPDYVGAFKDLDTMAGIADFNNANIHNNMQPGFTVIFKGPEPSDDAKDEIVDQIKNKYQDTENAGKPMVFFIEEENAIEIKPMESGDIADMFLNLSNEVKENIVVSHQVPRAVSGLMTPGALGGTKELVEGTEIVKTGYIYPAQTFLLNYFNNIMEINGLKDIAIINPATSLLRYSLGDLQPFLTIDEIRNYIGYEDLTTEEVVQEIEEEIEQEDNPTKIEE